MIPRVPLLACLLAALLGVHRSEADAVTPRAPPPALMPGPSDGIARPAAPDLNAACERCHTDIAAEWRGSLHRQAYTNDSFAAALRREPLPFCRGCHAPEADPERRAPKALANLGVGCVSCHTPNGGDAVLAAPRRDLSQETAPHKLLRDPQFASADACAGCHQFEFPGSHDLMQSTIGEHTASPYWATPCAGCHMQPTGEAKRHRSHAFVASREPAMLRQAIRATATRTGTAIFLDLAPGTVGHAFPTGDLFRRLAVVAEVIGDDGRPLAGASRFLTRHFTLSRHELADDRVGAVSLAGHDLVVPFELGPSANARQIRWRVDYERVAFPRAADEHAEVEARIVVAEGVLDP